MKMVITGTTGFIGGRLLQTARTVYGENVTAFSSRPFAGSHIVYQDRTDFCLTHADLTLVEEAEVLIHAGAFTPKSGAEANQVKGCNSNITVLEKLLLLPWRKLKKIVFLSTLDVYGSVDGPISEATPVDANSLYGLSKLYGERMVSQYAAERAVSSQVLRIGHVYGPGEEKYAKVIPKSIQDIVAGKDVELWGEGRELRSFIYIDDLVTSILKSVELPDDPGIINVVGGEAIAIRDLIKMLITLGGRGTKVSQREFSGATRDLVFDNTKLKHYLLSEESDFADGLRAEFAHIEGLCEN
jgi:UDP-glucose 4-epimerase